MVDSTYTAVVWNVYLNGVKLDLDKKNCIQNIKIEEQSDGSDTMTLLVADPEFMFMDENIFSEEATVSVDITIVGDMYTVFFDGYISAIDPDFPEEGVPTLTITCIDDGSHRMNRTEKKRSWDDVTNADVVKKIAKEYGLSCEVEVGYPFTKKDTITQSSVTDIAFIESLADSERVPFIAKVSGTTLLYKKKSLTDSSVCKLCYKKYPFDVQYFRAQINKETMSESVTKSDINTDTKETETSTASNKDTQSDTQGTPVTTSSSPLKSYKKYDATTGEWSSLEK